MCMNSLRCRKLGPFPWAGNAQKHLQSNCGDERRATTTFPTERVPSLACIIDPEKCLAAHLSQHDGCVTSTYDAKVIYHWRRWSPLQRILSAGSVPPFRGVCGRNIGTSIQESRSSQKFGDELYYPSTDCRICERRSRTTLDVRHAVPSFLVGTYLAFCYTNYYSDKFSLNPDRKSPDQSPRSLRLRNIKEIYSIQVIPQAPVTIPIPGPEPGICVSARSRHLFI